jgi:hypothetical protein
MRREAQNHAQFYNSPPIPIWGEPTFELTIPAGAKLPVSRALPFACFQLLSSRGLGQTFSVPSQPIHSANSHRCTMLLLMRNESSHSTKGEEKVSMSDTLERVEQAPSLARQAPLLKKGAHIPGTVPETGRVPKVLIKGDIRGYSPANTRVVCCAEASEGPLPHRNGRDAGTLTGHLDHRGQCAQPHGACPRCGIRRERNTGRRNTHATGKRTGDGSKWARVHRS